MKTHSRVVVIGGGVVGVSTLYHLALKGWTDAVLLERAELTAGSTWHAAGLLPLFNMSYTVGQLHKYSVDLYKRLPAETGQEVSFHALRQIPKLENVLKETLRLHPPLIILMRVARGEFEVAGFPIHEGEMVAASPAISNRIAEDFPDPDAFNPDRYEKPRQEDLINRWTWIPFGAGRHRCVGAAFATMQIKAIFSVLLREYDFEMAQPSESYRNDHSKMVVQLAQPAKVRYRKRG